MPELRNKIIFHKNSNEYKDTLEYHIERWENISSKYFRSFEINNWDQREKYSYILDDKFYLSIPDKNLDYFIETGISFQTRDLLLDLLTYNPSRHVEWSDLDPKVCYQSIFDKNWEKWRKEDDEKYSYLAQEIINKLKKNKIYSIL